MRIALIGDLQYWKADVENLEYKMKQVAAHKPDFAVVMGDFGGSQMRSIPGLEETKRHVDLIGCPWQAIMGNHDVEYSPDNINDYDPVGSFRYVFGTEPWSATVLDGVLILCITVERQPLESMRTIHAVYVSDKQFRWAEEQLLAHEGMPTILVTHPPMAGSGLRCDRPLHTAALDTYLDQTYSEERWHRLLKDFPQIRAWCSAHYHMGHDYDTAITERDGVVHISCGVMTCCTRDESCNTRILDITKDKRLVVSTLDHNNDSELIWDATVDLTGTQKPTGRVAPVKYGEILLGEDEPCKVWYLGEPQRFYISTKKRLLWEYNCSLWEFSGAIALEKKVTDLRIDGDRLFIGYDSSVGSVDIHSRMRFDWDNLRCQELKEEKEMSGSPLPTLGFTTRASKEGVYISIIN